MRYESAEDHSGIAGVSGVCFRSSLYWRFAMRVTIAVCVMAITEAAVAISLIRAGHWIAGLCVALILMGGTSVKWGSEKEQ